MRINLRCQLTGEPTTIPLEVDRGSTVQSVIIDCCNQLDIPIRKNLQLRNENDEVLPDNDTIFACSVRNSDTLYLTLMEDHQDDETVPINRPLMPTIRQPTSWPVLLAIGLLFVILSIGGIVILSIFYVKDCVESGHGIVFDAGSSHTNMSIYRWPEEENNGTGKVKQIGSCQAEGGGLSDYADRPADAGPSLKGCLDQAKATLKEEDNSNTPQYLGATAGMRLLKATAPSSSDSIFDSVREFMGKYPFNFGKPEQQARILVGGEEGTFGWVSANYLSNTLNEGPSSLMEAVTEAVSYITSESPSDTKNTLGAMDLGGASTQMSFIPEDPSALPKGYDYYLRLYGTDYHVYSHSYLCYGINEAIRRYKALLVENSNYANVTENPCTAIGYTEPVDGAYLWTAPCSQGPQALAGFGSEVKPPDHLVNDANSTTFYLVGTSQPAECAEVTAGLFNFDQNCTIPPCSFNGVHQPRPFGQFLAFSVFAKVFEGLNISTAPTISELNATRYDFCAKTYEEIQSLPGFNKYLLLYCFEIHYIWTLLIDGYGFDEETWNIEVKPDIEGVELGWSLGFMINATNRIPIESTCTDLSDAVFFGILAVLLFVFILGVILLVCATLAKRRVSEATYEDVDASYGRV